MSVVQFLEEERPSLYEGRKWLHHRKKRGQRLKLRIHPLDLREHHALVGHRLSNIVERIGQGLQLEATVCGGYIALSEVAELGLKVYGTGGLVVLHHVLDRRPNGGNSGRRCHDGVEDLKRNRFVKPREHGGVATLPIGIF